MIQRVPGHIFRADASSRYLPWILMLASFLAAISLAAILVVERTLDRWDEATPNLITIQLAPTDDQGIDALNARALEQKLKADPQVAEVKLLPASAVVELLAPWLGSEASASDLPLPRVLHLQLRQYDQASAAQIATSIKQQVPDAIVDDHRIWRSRLVSYTSWLRGGLALQLVLVLAVTLLTAIFLTLSRMTIHRETIRLLHQMGADDTFIIAGVVRQTALSAAIAAACGCLLAAALLFALTEASAGMDDVFMPVLRLSGADWLWLLAVPVALVALTVWVAASTAKRRLRRLA